MATKTKLDPIGLEVVRGRLVSITDEMLHGLVKSSFSSVIKEAADASTALFDLNGQCVAQAASIPILLGTLLSAIKEVLRDFPPEAMRAGDVYITNDPYRGGTHIPDIILLSPIFIGGAPVALSCTIAHHRDLGGRTPGSCPVDATEIFQEGIRIPPMRLFDAGRRIEGVHTLLQANSRLPDNVAGDLAAQIGACRIGERRFAELANEYGIGTLLAMVSELLDQSERMTRLRIAALPEGRYEFEDFLDNDGVDLDRLVPLKLAVTVKGGAVTIDFTGSSPQVRGPLNAPVSVAVAASFYVVRCLTDPRIFSNSGCFRPISVITPPGSIVNPRLPAPVNARSMTFNLIVDMLFGAFAQAMPGREPAAGFEFPICHFGGIDPRSNRPFVFSEIGTGGFGARAHRDGVDVFRSKAGDTLSMPVEANEMDFPVRIEKLSLRRDSGGPGRFRGGLGYVKAYRMLADGITVAVRGERHYTAPWGLDEGFPAQCSVAQVFRQDGSCETVKSKKMLSLNHGDIVVLMSAGGGGYGDPLARPADAVLGDVLDGKISIDHAKSSYGLAFNEAGDILNVGASRRERETLRG